MKTAAPIRLKYALLANDSGVWGEEPSGLSDCIVLRSTEQTLEGDWRIADPARRSLNEKDRSASQLRAGDLLVTKTSGSPRHIGKTTIVTTEVAALSPSFGNFMQRLRVGSGWNPRYIWRLLNHDLVRDQLKLMSTTSTGLANLSGAVLGNVSIPCWPLEQQNAIADYLDRETAQIDTLIEEQQRLIELLRERRQATIDMSIAETAARVHQLRRAITFLTSGSRGWGDFYADTGERFVRIGNLPRHGLDLRGEVQYIELPEGVTEGSRTRLNVDDLLFSITAYLGSVAVVDPEWVGSYVSQHVALCRVDHRILNPNFVGWAMLTTAGQDQLKVGAAGGTKVQLALEDIRTLRVPYATLQEQRQIVAYLDRETTKIDALINETERFIELSRERRSALITAAVTGQIEIPGAA